MQFLSSLFYLGHQRVPLLAARYRILGFKGLISAEPRCVTSLFVQSSKQLFLTYFLVPPSLHPLCQAGGSAEPRVMSEPSKWESQSLSQAPGVTSKCLEGSRKANNIEYKVGEGRKNTAKPGT